MAGTPLAHAQPGVKQQQCPTIALYKACLFIQCVVVVSRLPVYL